MIPGSFLKMKVSGKRTREAVRESRLKVIAGGSYCLNWTDAGELNKCLLDFPGM
jgi:hypothetical protein